MPQGATQRKSIYIIDHVEALSESVFSPNVHSSNRRFQPQVADFPSSSEPRVGLLLPSPYTNRRVHEALSAKLLKHVEQHYRHQGVSFVGVANFLLNNGHLSAPEIYHSGWRAVQISKTLLPYVPLLLSGEVCYKQYSQQEQEAYLLQNGCERMTIHSHVQVFAGDKLKRLFPAGGLPLIHQHISAHESFAQEVEHKYIHTLKWHTGEVCLQKCAIV